MNPKSHPEREPKRDELADAEAYLAELEHASIPEGAPGAPPQPEPPKPPPVTNNLDHDAFDQRLFNEILEASEELSAIPQDDAAPRTMPKLLEDFFFALFKVKPKLIDEEQISGEHARVNRPFVERLLEDERTAFLRISTCMDDMASALGALEAGRAALQELKDRPDLRSWTTPETDEESESAEPPAPPLPRDTRRLVRRALEAAWEAVEGYQEALEGWGLSAGDLRQAPLKERLDIARKLKSPRMASFATLLGRMRNSAISSAPQRLTSGVDEVHSVTTGGPIERVLPQELAAGLASGEAALRANFYRKMAEGSLLSYELTSTERAARGPIVAMIDASPSMEGSPMDWATALAAALAQGPAAREGRPVYLIYFNTRIVKEIELRPHERDPRKLLDAAMVGTSGGTDYDVPLRRALEIARAGASYRDADLVIITDGQCHLSERGVAELSEARSSSGLSLYAVLCGKYASAADVERYASGVYHAERDLLAAGGGGGDEIARDLFRQL